MSGASIPAIIETWKKNLAIPGKPNEWEGKELLSEMGIPGKSGILISPAESEEKAFSKAESVLTFPCVVKICSGEILHKTDAGGVALNITKAQLPATLARFRKTFPGQGILVSDMVRYQGGEIILGALYDPVFGPTVMVGAGGILTELYNDVSFRLAPCSGTEALRMLQELTIFPVLNGYRGMTRNCEELALIIEKVSVLCEELIEPGCQLDINPIVWTGETWYALDAMIILG